MSQSDLKQLIDQYLAEGTVMQLATVKDGQPWLCTVHYSFDDNWNVYWMSLKTRRHSQELVSNSKVAAGIVRDPKLKQCLHFEGIAQEVVVEQLEHADKMYSQRYGNKPRRLEGARSGKPDSHTYYVIKPTYMVLFDEVNFPDNPRQEYKLS